MWCFVWGVNDVTAGLRTYPKSMLAKDNISLLCYGIKGGFGQLMAENDFSN